MFTTVANKVRLKECLEIFTASNKQTYKNAGPGIYLENSAASLYSFPERKIISHSLRNSIGKVSPIAIHTRDEYRLNNLL